MTPYDRRTFIKRSALLTGAGVTLRLFPVTTITSDSTYARNLDSFFPHARNTPEVIAHRGGNGQWPGETMRAFREAAKLKVDVLEMDVFVSRNGELMLMHDHEIEKTTEGEGLINNLHSDYLQTLNAGHKWTADGKLYPFKGKSVLTPEYKDLRVPRLKEVFDEFPDARMIIEMKKANTSPAPALSRMIRECGMTNNVLVASFVGKFMTEFRRLSPDVATSFSLSTQDLRRLISGKKLSNHQKDPAAIQLPYWSITEEVVRRAHERNVKVHAWTVDRLDKMYLMWNQGVDGIITDYPGPLLALLGRIRLGNTVEEL